MSLLNLKCSQPQRNALQWEWKLAEIQKEVFSDSQMLSTRKMCNAGLSVVVFYTQSIGLAGEPDRPVFEYSNNLNVLIITKRVGPTEVTGGCDNFQLSDIHY